jgi:small conductance mechanosensitive channel
MMQIPQMPQQWRSQLDEVARWRTDGLDFLHQHAPRIVVIVAVAFILIRLLHVITRRLTRFSQSQELPSTIRAQQLRTLASVVNGVGLFVIVFLAIMEVLQQVGISVGPLLASAGVVGLAIGFGAQTLVKDVINGFFILMENQYDLGDVVKIAGVSGTVERMTLRRTVLRDAEGTQHTVPNSQISVVSNLTRDWTQTAVQIAVSYRADSDRVIDLLREIADELRADPNFADSILADIQVPGIERVAGSEVDYLMLIKTKPGTQYALLRELRRRIKATFDKNGIEPAGAAPLYVLSQTPGK